MCSKKKKKKDCIMLSSRLILSFENSDFTKNLKPIMDKLIDRKYHPARRRRYFRSLCEPASVSAASCSNPMQRKASGPTLKPAPQSAAGRTRGERRRREGGREAAGEFCKNNHHPVGEGGGSEGRADSKRSVCVCVCV